MFAFLHKKQPAPLPPLASKLTCGESLEIINHLDKVLTILHHDNKRGYVNDWVLVEGGLEAARAHFDLYMQEIK